MKKNNLWLTIFSSLSGIFILISAYTDIPAISQIRQYILQWSIFVFAIVLFFGVIDFILNRIRGIRSFSLDSICCMLCVAVFFGVLFWGFYTGFDNADYQSVFFNIFSSAEGVLTGLICLGFLVGLPRLAHSKSSMLKKSFVVSVAVFLILFSGVLDRFPLSKTALQGIELIESLPNGGLFGLILGLALSALTIGLRIIFLGEHPFRRDKP